MPCAWIRAQASSGLIVLDENILEGQRQLLEAAGVVAHQLGVDIGRKGMKDEEITALLRSQRGATFFTRDADFYREEVRHRSYCVVVTNAGQSEVAGFIRRFLSHPDFDTPAKRVGRVVRGLERAFGCEPPTVSG